MKKVLLDACVDARLKWEIDGFVTRHCHEMGWHQLTNGVLFAQAESDGFDILVTVDKNLAYQQSLAGRSISVITLAPKFVRLADLIPLIPQLQSTIQACGKGEFHIVK